MNSKCLLLSKELFKSEWIKEEADLSDALKLTALDEIGVHVTEENLSLMHRTFGRTLEVSASDLSLCTFTNLIRTQCLVATEEGIDGSSFLAPLLSDLRKFSAEHLGMLAFAIASILPPTRLCKPGMQTFSCC